MQLGLELREKSRVMKRDDNKCAKIYWKNTPKSNRNRLKKTASRGQNLIKAKLAKLNLKVEMIWVRNKVETILMKTLN